MGCPHTHRGARLTSCQGLYQKALCPGLTVIKIFLISTWGLQTLWCGVTSTHLPVCLRQPGVQAGGRGREWNGASVGLLFCGAALAMDHPLLACSLPLTPPERLTQGASLARPAPESVAQEKKRELTFGPLSGVQSAKAARVIWFLSLADWVPATSAD